MDKLAIQAVRELLSLSVHEVEAPPKAIKPFAKCVVNARSTPSFFNTWEQGAVCGYLTVRNEPHAVVAYSERPFVGDHPDYDIVHMTRVKPWRKIPERVFKL